MGVAIGTAVGAAMDNLGLWIAVGAAIGSAAKKKRSYDERG